MHCIHTHTHTNTHTHIAQQLMHQSMRYIITLHTCGLESLPHEPTTQHGAAVVDARTGTAHAACLYSQEPVHELILNSMAVQIEL